MERMLVLQPVSMVYTDWNKAGEVEVDVEVEVEEVDEEEYLKYLQLYGGRGCE